MGQQQLLLVILVTIIVGIATVVAINTFGSAADAANIDSVRNDVLAIASSAQGYYMKPAMLGGGGRTFTGLTFNELAFPANGISADGLTAQNENGRYVLAVAGGGAEFTVTAHPASDAAYVPGAVDANGVLTGGTAAASVGTATVTPNSSTPLNFGGSGS
jgi:Tfp pilus assembly protein PilE